MEKPENTTTTATEKEEVPNNAHVNETAKEVLSDTNAIEKLTTLVSESEKNPAVLNVTDDPEFMEWGNPKKSEVDAPASDSSANSDSTNSSDDKDGKENVEEEEDEEVEEEIEDPEKEVEQKDPEWLSESIKDFQAENETPQETITKIVQRTKELEQTLKEEDEANEKLVTIFNQQPQIKDLVRLLDKGYSAEEALVSVFDIDELIELKNDPNVKEKLIEKKVKREMQDTQLKKEVEDNNSNSFKNLESYYTEKKLENEGKEKFKETLDNLITPIFKGLISKDLISIIDKGLRYDTDVKNVASKSKAEGLNTQVKKEIAKKRGDGLPNVHSKNVDSSPRSVNPISKSLITDGNWG